MLRLVSKPGNSLCRSSTSSKTTTSASTHTATNSVSTIVSGTRQSLDSSLRPFHNKNKINNNIKSIKRCLHGNNHNRYNNKGNSISSNSNKKNCHTGTSLNHKNHYTGMNTSTTNGRTLHLRSMVGRDTDIQNNNNKNHCCYDSKHQSSSSSPSSLPPSSSLFFPQNLTGDFCNELIPCSPIFPNSPYLTSSSSLTSTSTSLLHRRHNKSSLLLSYPTNVSVAVASPVVLMTRSRYYSTNNNNNNNNNENNSADSVNNNSSKQQLQQQQQQQQQSPVQQNNTSTTNTTANANTTTTASEATSESTTSTTTSTTKNARETAEAHFREIVDEVVGPRLKKVSTDMNVGDLMSVYGIVTLIGIIIIAPMVIRHMRRSDSTYEDIDPEDPVQDLANILEEEFLAEDESLDGNGSNGNSNKKGGLDSLAADLLNSPRIQKAVNQLVAQLLQSPEVKHAAQTLLKELWNDLVADPETTRQIIHLLQHAIQDEQIKEAAIQLVTEVFSDKEVLDELVELVQKLGQEREVQEATQALLVESAHNALNDPEILDHSMEFATDVVGDDVVQQTAGEALYNTLSYAVRPTLSIALSIFGASLIFLSVAAFRTANSPEQAVEEALLKTLESTKNMEKIWKVLSLPFDLLVSAKEALAWLLSLPFHMASKSLHSLGRAGSAATTFLANFLQWIFQLPTRFFHSIMGALGSSLQLLSQQINETSNATISAISASFLGVFVRNLANLVATTIHGTRATFDSTKLLVMDGFMTVDAHVRMATEIMMEAYSRTVATFIATNERMTDGMLQLQTISDQLAKEAFRRYDHLNELATALGFFIEDFIEMILSGNIINGGSGSSSNRGGGSSSRRRSGRNTPRSGSRR